MALKGNLRDVGLNQLLNLIHLAHKTGSLTLHNDNGASPACLFFREGRLIYAVLEGQDARLTDILVKMGKLTPTQANGVRARSKVDTDKELGVLMIQNGILSQSDIVQGVKSYLLESVYQLFAWSGGTFRFDANRLPPEERITVPINLDNLIIEGGRRAQELERLRDEIPDLDVTLRFSERPEASVRNINLSVEQWKVVSYINARNTIRQIGTSLKMDEFQVRRIVNGLLTAGLVEIGKPKTKAAKPVAPPPPPPVPPSAPAKPAPGAIVSRSVLLRIVNRIRGL